MKKIALPAIVMLMMLFTGCRKEMETDSQRLWNTIEDIVRTQQIQRLVPTTSPNLDPSNTYLIGDYGSVYSFRAPMLTVGPASYNLNTMCTYEVMTISSYKCLVLYFYK